MEKKHKHLEFIQAAISRMARNSFAMKGWAVTLVAGIFAIASKDDAKWYFLIVYIPILVFWGIDAYYLCQERLYRSLYNKVRTMDEDKIDYDMNVTLEEYKCKKNTWHSCLFSRTEIWFYLPLIILSTIIVILMACL